MADLRSILFAPLFARRGFTNPLGKLVDLGKCRVHDEAAEVVRQKAAAVRLPVAEYLRNYIELGHIGREEIDRRNTIRLDAIELVVPKRDGNGTSE